MSIDWESKVGAQVVKVFGTDTPAIYMPAAGSPYPVTPVFDEAYREIIILDGESPTSDAKPVVGINDSQFQAEPVQGDKIQIWLKGVPYKTYLVKEVRSDSHGVTRLELNFASTP